ncbi:MAG: tetratricopeptide repeat protein [Planctomycetes bacterium]|nr:tetratricopeptide repeat protein [Planctomycetota bacterium]
MQPDRLVLPAPLRADLEQSGLAFLAEFYAAAVRHRPDNLEALAELAHAYTRLGRVAEGLAVDRRLAELEPDNPTVHYNLACSLALADESEAALDALERAVDLGYTDADFLSTDDDLKSVRDDARFVRLVERLRHPA